ncbi:S41 family peptidase [Pedobacter sp. WC2501]|uniref:S41 family peptidase n=1 Tax=Pedobacter sp. WC2501 TaxID=3461400 RepID=UPI0040464295
MEKNRIKYLLFLFFMYPLCTYSQQDKYSPGKEIIKLKNEVFSIIKSSSMYRDSVDWHGVTQELKALKFTENDSTSKRILYDFFTKKLREAGDKHSFFISKNSISKIVGTPVSLNPEADYLGEGIGWIKVPECLTFDAKKDISFANRIRSEIKRIDSAHNILGWIVDLRHNGGGNMWPMLAGLNALSEDGTVGYFVDPKSKKQQPWIIQNGKLFSSTIISYKIKNTKTKIAVLIDSLTGSSGEMTAISFMGLPNVKVFGQPSAGYTTVNNKYAFSDGSQLLLAERFAADRTGKTYKVKVIPDVNVNDLSNTKSDGVVLTAKKWLLE